MKRFYNIFLGLLCLIVALSFLPWLYSIAFPSDNSEQFAVFSPVNDSFIVTDKDGELLRIFAIDANGDTIAPSLTKAERDSLVPQMYFNQLAARNAIPDTIAGKAVDIPTLKMSQWVFTSMPRELNKHHPGVYPIMESRPKRVDLEDPEEVFTLDGDIRFIKMSSNKENPHRSSRFSKVFADKGFVYPEVSASANITAKKPYDEGYLLIDSNNQLFHMKMQAGQPYLAKIQMPEGAIPTYAFILENPDRELIGLVSTADGSFYAIEREGYNPIKLPVDKVDPSSQRIVIMRNMFNWIVRIADERGSLWTAINSDDFSQLGVYYKERKSNVAEQVAHWIFPLRISFTEISDCFAYPRISHFSFPATLIWAVILLLIILFLTRKKHKQ